MTPEEQETEAAVRRLYEAYLANDPDGMLGTMSEDVRIRFLGRVDFRGIDEATRFFHAQPSLFENLDFHVRTLIVDGAYAAGVWEETGTTVHGAPYANHGVDVFEVRRGRIVELHENNDVTVHRAHFGQAS